MDEDSSRAALDYKLLSDCRQYLWTRLSFCASQTLFKTSFNISYFLYYFFVVSLGLLTLRGCFFHAFSSRYLYSLWFFGSMDRTETSYTYSQFQKSGRFTAPATVIPRFKNYSVDDFHFLAVLGKGSFGKVSRGLSSTYSTTYNLYIIYFSRFCWLSCVTRHITMPSSVSRRTLCWRTTMWTRLWSSVRCSHWAPSIPICAICFAPFKQRYV